MLYAQDPSMKQDSNNLSLDQYFQDVVAILHHQSRKAFDIDLSQKSSINHDIQTQDINESAESSDVIGWNELS